MRSCSTLGPTMRVLMRVAWDSANTSRDTTEPAPGKGRRRAGVGGRTPPRQHGASSSCPRGGGGRTLPQGLTWDVLLDELDVEGLPVRQRRRGGRRQSGGEEEGRRQPLLGAARRLHQERRAHKFRGGAAKGGGLEHRAGVPPAERGECVVAGRRRLLVVGRTRGGGAGAASRGSYEAPGAHFRTLASLAASALPPGPGKATWTGTANRLPLL